MICQKKYPIVDDEENSNEAAIGGHLNKNKPGKGSKNNLLFAIPKIDN